MYNQNTTEGNGVSFKQAVYLSKYSFTLQKLLIIRIQRLRRIQLIVVL